LVDIYTVLGLISALSVIVPGLILLTLIRGVKIASLRNITIMLSAFGILHGFYHLSYLINLVEYAPYLDLATALILVMLGLYYSDRVVAISFFLLALPETAGYVVPIALAIAFILFARLAIKSKSISSLQAQLSIFILIWDIAELLRSLLLLNVISASPSLQLFGLELHTFAMVAFGVFIISRFYRAVTNAGNNAPEWLTKQSTRPTGKEGSRS
jgi:hypothetical protein